MYSDYMESRLEGNEKILELSAPSSFEEAASAFSSSPLSSFLSFSVPLSLSLSFFPPNSPYPYTLPSTHI